MRVPRAWPGGVTAGRNCVGEGSTDPATPLRDGPRMRECATARAITAHVRQCGRAGQNDLVTVGEAVGNAGHCWRCSSIIRKDAKRGRRQAPRLLKHAALAKRRGIEIVGTFGVPPGGRPGRLRASDNGTLWLPVRPRIARREATAEPDGRAALAEQSSSPRETNSHLPSRLAASWRSRPGAALVTEDQ
jgi:hypothetical protein